MLEVQSDNPSGKARRISIWGAVPTDYPVAGLDIMTSMFLIVELTNPELPKERRGDLVLSMITANRECGVHTDTGYVHDLYSKADIVAINLGSAV
jgi:hypothetical protein